MTTPEPPAPQPPATPAMKAWAETLETRFTGLGLTLADEDTAAAFRLTLQICAQAIEGSQATGLIHVEDSELAELLAMVRGMEQAPGLI
ncbi:hypothetical protein [Streptomyces seoulensis]|nr:hypothetical protein [Streptomyces seoulensis]